jgi:hypothetical protein
MIFRMSKTCGMCAGPVFSGWDFVILESGRAIVASQPGGSTRFADVMLSAADRDKVVALMKTLIPGAPQLLGKVHVSDGSGFAATAWYEGEPFTVTGSTMDSYSGTSDGPRYDALESIDSLVRQRAIGAPEYAPAAIALATQKVTYALPSQPSPWPLMPLDTLGQPSDPSGQMRCGIVTGEQLTSLMKAVYPVAASSWSSAGEVYFVSVLPLVPGQTTCQDAFG